MVICIPQNKAWIRGRKFFSGLAVDIMQFAYFSNTFLRKIEKGDHIPHLPW